MELTIRRAPLGELKPDPDNARSHDERNVAAIKRSLEEFGQVEPLVVQKGTSKVVGGNARLAAMYQLGWTECDVVEVEVDNLKAMALGVALNRTAELAGWDTDNLAAIIQQLREEDESLMFVTGFSDGDIDSILANPSMADDSPVEIREITEAENPPMCWTVIGVPLSEQSRVQRLIEELGEVNHLFVSHRTVDVETRDR
jgi:ParB-like chromosome segregation protein Spo0J